MKEASYSEANYNAFNAFVPRLVTDMGNYRQGFQLLCHSLMCRSEAQHFRQTHIFSVQFCQIRCKSVSFSQMCLGHVIQKK